MSSLVNRFNKKWLVCCTVGVTTVLATGVALNAVAQADEPKDAFTKRIYVGAGAGISKLDPKTFTNTLSVSDDTDSGYHVTLGYDFTIRLSAEVYYANLGEAQIAFLGSDVGSVDYAVYGVSGIAYLYNSQSGFSGRAGHASLSRREGLSLYARLGVGGVSADSNLDYRVDHRAHLAMGAGAEYGFKNGFAIRGEYMALDSDQSYGQISLLKRFGRSQNAAPVLVPAAIPTVTPKAADLVEPANPETVAVQAFPTVNFAFDSSAISARASAKLQSVVEIMGSSDRKITLEGHTDWINTDQYNYDLSMRRARSVRDYLVSEGVNPNRIKVLGFGESRPLVSNETSEGRAMNRRVNIRDN